MGKNSFKNMKVPVYIDDVPPTDTESYENYSFNEESKKTMSFEKDFLKAMKGRSPAVMRLRTRSNDTKEFHDKEIEFPSFYHNLAEFTGGEVLIGQFFVDRAHYTKTDHFSCMVEGTAHLRLVPHINRHEIYAG